MVRKTRIEKPPEQRLNECETHLYFLWDARRLYRAQKDRYKQIAAELRVLVGDHKPKRRLLLSLMNEFGFSFEVGWRDDPEHQALTEEVQQALGDEAKLAEVLKKQAAFRRVVHFPEYVEKALAVYVAPYDYSYRDLVLAVAQQLGSGHEDTAVDEPLLQLRQYVIGGDEGHIAPLINFADLVLEVGISFIAFVADEHGYKPECFQLA
jgi:hypothetical protein